MSRTLWAGTQDLKNLASAPEGPQPGGERVCQHSSTSTGGHEPLGEDTPRNERQRGPLVRWPAVWRREAPSPRRRTNQRQVRLCRNRDPTDVPRPYYVAHQPDALNSSGARGKRATLLTSTAICQLRKQHHILGRLRCPTARVGNSQHRLRRPGVHLSLEGKGGRPSPELRTRWHRSINRTGRAAVHHGTWGR
jgi:hypothetical protein